jgi:hypothetical protein
VQPVGVDAPEDRADHFHARGDEDHEQGLQA